MTVTRPLTKLLTSPSKVAHALDWGKAAGGTLVSAAVGTDRIDLAAGSHPSSGEPSQPLPSVPVHTSLVRGRRVVDPAVARELRAVLAQWNACGLVVHWPVQREGWCGAACGRVLFTLDHLTATDVLNRPTCLWDGGGARHPHHHEAPYEDEWGRSPLYSEIAPRGVRFHSASREQYEAVSAPSAERVWDDFCHAHWPEYHDRDGLLLRPHVGGRSTSPSTAAPIPSRAANAGAPAPPPAQSSKPWLSSPATLTLSSKYDAAWLDDDLP